MIKHKIWNIKNTEDDLNDLTTQLNISPIVANVLMERGYNNYEKAKYFLEADINTLSNPFEMHGIREAAEKILEAILNKEKIMIYGDYDVDGITSTALLIQFFTELELEVDYYIPDRLEEGYGLNYNALKEIKEKNIDLVITVDCGITAVKEIDQAMELGLKFVVTDHHQALDELPNCTIVNPVLDDVNSPWYNLAGVGVAFKLIQGLSRILPEQKKHDITKYLDLVALGTVADVVPLKDENRILVKNGLKQINQGKRIGLKALCEVSGIDKQRISAGQVGFGIAPRLNACGRLKDASVGVRLLLTDNEEEAIAIAEELNAINIERQDLEAKILKEAIEMAESLDKEKTSVLVLGSKDWHPGVIGIVASRLVDKYYLPTILLSFKDGLAKGSGRSISNFHLHKALIQCEDLLNQFGGHSQAAGLSLEEENIPRFISRINEYAFSNLTSEDFKEKLKINSEIDLSEVDFEIYKQLEKLEPYGYANPRPVFALKKIKASQVAKLGKEGKHLKLSFNTQGESWEALAFNMSEYETLTNESPFLDLAFTLDKNEFRGRTTLQLILKDMKSFAQADNPYEEQALLKESPSPYKTNLKLIDYRNCSDKINYVKKLSLKQEKMIIKTNFQQNALELALKLKNQLPEIKDEIVCFKEALDLRENGQSKELLEERDWKILITSNLLMDSIILPENYNLVMYDLPMCKKDIDPITSFLDQDNVVKKIHLIYTKEDCSLNDLILRQRAPDRECLAKFYILLKKLAQKNKTLNLTHHEIAKGTKLYKIEGLNEESMLGWLAVLEELELILQINTGKDKSIKIKENPPKVNLENSVIFRQGLKNRLEYEEVLKIAFSNYDYMKDYICS